LKLQFVPGSDSAEWILIKGSPGSVLTVVEVKRHDFEIGNGILPALNVLP